MDINNTLFGYGYKLHVERDYQQIIRISDSLVIETLDSDDSVEHWIRKELQMRPY